jgi:hypothetical protein
MMDLLKRVVLTGTALALLIVAERAFGMVAAFVAAGVLFVGYVAYISFRETAAEESDDDPESGRSV